MKNMCFQILILISCLDMFYGKIIFGQDEDSAVTLVKHFFQKNIIPDVNNVKVVNFGYDVGNPVDFHTLMRNFNDEHAMVTLTLSDVDQTILHNEDKAFLLLLTNEQISRAYQFFDPYKMLVLESVSAMILFDRDFTREQFTNLYERPQAMNFHQIIYAFPSFEPHTNDVFIKEEKGTLIFYLENLYLSRLSSTFKVTKFVTNKEKINRTLIRLQIQQRLNMEEINKFPIKFLLFLRPLSVEKNPSKSRTEPLKGIEVYILKILAQSLQSQYTLKVGRPEDYGISFANQSLTKALTDVRDWKYDLSFNRYPVMASGQGVGVMPYDQEVYCFVMLRPKTQLRKWSILMPFSKSVWISLLLTKIAVYAIYLFIKEKHWTVMWMFQSSISTTHVPARRLHHRIFWSIWLHFVFVINTSYLCFFVTQLVPRQKTHPYKTIRDLVTRNITLLSEAGHFQEIRQAFPNKQLTPYYGELQYINESSALLTSYLSRIKLLQLTGGKFYKVDECLQPRTVGPLMSSRHPNFYRMIGIMLRVVRAGLNVRWLRLYQSAAKLPGNKTTPDYGWWEKEKNLPLKFEELEIIFCFFTLGLVLSCVVFLCEVLHFRITKKKTKVRPEIIRVFPYTD